MIGYFPTPYPDELFYSLFARYCKIMGRSNMALRNELFGSIQGGRSIEFPARLSCVAKQLSYWPETFNEENIIQQTTLFPLHAPFLSSDRQTYIKDQMRGDKGYRIYYVLGYSSAKMSSPERLKYCPVCYANDVKKFGESYWHRIPQARGVHVCHLHRVFLEESPPEGIRRYSRTRIYGADDIVVPGPPRALDGHPFAGLLSAISEDVAFLLNLPENAWDLAAVKQRYRNLFRAKGMISRNERILFNSNHIHEFVEYYSRELLATLNSDITNPEANWLIGFLHDWNGKRTMVPLRHILLIHFLGSDAKRFFQRAQEETESTPFPITAANRAEAFSHRASVIQQHWSDPSISAREIGRILGIDHKTVNSIAIQSGLPFPRFKGPNQRYEVCRLEKRKEWITLLEANPDKSTTELCRISPRLHGWLSFNDKDWLTKNKPRRKYPKRRNSKDWECVDREIAIAIPAIANEIVRQSGRPVRATLTEILERLGKHDFVSQNIPRLPLTKQALAEHVETRENYALRKIAWIVERYSSEHRHFSRAVFFDRLKIAWAKENPIIMDAAERAFNELKSREERGWEF